MPSLNSILKPVETLVVHFGAENVSVTYRPQYLTPEYEEKLKALHNEDKATEAFLELFCLAVVSWDLKMNESDTAPIPITKEALRRVPYEILGDVLSKVQEAVVPNSPKGQSFADISPQADGSAPSPSGIA